MVSGAYGEILDIDGAEEWTIDARDAKDVILESVVLTAGKPGTGDAIATPFSFKRNAADIRSLRIRYTGASGAVGLAFDNFSPACSAPVEVSARGGALASPPSDSRRRLPTASARARDEAEPHAQRDTYVAALRRFRRSEEVAELIAVLVVEGHESSLIVPGERDVEEVDDVSERRDLDPVVSARAVRTSMACASPSART